MWSNLLSAALLIASLALGNFYVVAGAMKTLVSRDPGNAPTKLPESGVPERYNKLGIKAQHLDPERQAAWEHQAKLMGGKCQEEVNLIKDKLDRDAMPASTFLPLDRSVKKPLSYGEQMVRKHYWRLARRISDSYTAPKISGPRLCSLIIDARTTLSNPKWLNRVQSCEHGHDTAWICTTTVLSESLGKVDKGHFGCANDHRAKCEDLGLSVSRVNHWDISTLAKV